MFNLQVLHPETGTVQAHRLDPEQEQTFLIGRHPSCQIMLDRPEVSRIHGQLSWHGDRIYYSDLGSTDGSKVNNQDILINYQHVLRTGDTVHIGEFVILIGAIQVPDKTAPLKPTRLRCIQVIDQTPDVKTFRWVGAEGERFEYLPGQFVLLDLVIDGQSVSRCYSVSSSPSRPYVLEFTVKRVGLVSNWLHESVSEGFELTIMGISGSFVYTGPKEKVLLLSAGSGITPMMSMVRWISDMAHPVDVVFLHSARSPQDIIARSELAFLAMENLQVWFTVTEPGEDWSGLRGRVDRTMLMSVPDLLDRTVYVCGPEGFMTGVRQALLDLGLPPGQYYEESFGGAPSIIEAPKVETTATIEFAKSNKTIKPNAGETLLEAGLRSGITMTHGCKIGACGVCKLKLKSGAVDYVRSPLALPGGGSGFVLPCVACARDAVVVEG
jgi:glycine betaine catabolism B